MAIYPDTLSTMVGRVQQIKPNAKPEQCRNWLNDRVREAIDARPFWSDMMRNGIISIPNPYTTGTVSASYQSNLLIGSGTGWPVADLVNTTLTTGVSAIGYQWVTPASMNGITGDTLLLVDAGTPSQEVVSVVQVGQTSFLAQFQFTHNGSQNNPQSGTIATLTCSSLTQLQIQMASYQPIFTVNAVVSPTEIIMDQQFGGPSVSATNYSILKVYCTMPSDFKDFLSVKDPVQGIPLEFHVSQRQIDCIDPQRSSSGEPQCLVDRIPDSNGNMQYEIYPTSVSARQLPYIYCAQWPEMKKPSDKPPWFINPSVFVYGATADALITKLGKTDEYYDPVGSKYWLQRFTSALEAAVNADESKAVRNYTTAMDQLWGFSLNSKFGQSHDIQAILGYF